MSLIQIPGRSSIWACCLIIALTTIPYYLSIVSTWHIIASKVFIVLHTRLATSELLTQSEWNLSSKQTTSPTPIVVVRIRPQPDKNDERDSVCAVRHRPTSDNEMGVVDVYRPCRGLRTQDVLMVCRLGQSRALSTE